MPLEALIFDVDGTLAETEEQHRLSFNAAFSAAGLDWHWDIPLYTRLLRVTGGKERIAHFIDAFGASPALNGEGIGRLHAAKSAHYAAAVEAGAVRLRPGIERLLGDAWRVGLPVGIATTTTPANVDALLRACLGPGGASRFAAIAAGDCVGRKKPAPDIYSLVLQQLGVDGANAVAIEDSRNGLLSARAAGLPVVITRSIYSAGDDFDGATAVLDHLGDPAVPCQVFEGAVPEAGMITLEWLQNALAEKRRRHAG